MPITPSTDSWDRYWQSSPDEAAYCSEGVSDSATRGFWMAVFQSAKNSGGDLRVVDFCSGNGAVIRAAMEVFRAALPVFCCIDLSPAAIESLQIQFPGVRGVVSDARSIPLDDKSFTLATSQFGIEYAGLEAINEMFRVLAPGGRVALLLHHRESSISRKCNANVAAMHRLQALQFLPLARRMFEAGFAPARDPLVRDSVARQYELASQVWHAARLGTTALLEEFGEEICGGALLRLHGDISRMHARIQFQEPAAVLRWFDYMEAELAAYSKRMESQMRAAVDAESFLGLCRKLSDAGMKLQRNDALTLAGQELPLAWALVAEKSA